MASRNQILNDNTNSFPNNNSGQITPADLRDFNSAFVNSVYFLDEPIPLATSASFATTASFLTGNVTSASYALTASYALNAGIVDSGSFATTGSNTFTGINNFQAATNLQGPTNVGNVLSFTASRFASSVENFADLEMLDSTRFGFNVKNLTSSTSGSEFTTVNNASGQFTETGFTTYYGGTTGTFKVKNDNGATSATATVDTFTINGDLNVVGNISGSIASASFATTASYANNASTADSAVSASYATFASASEYADVADFAFAATSASNAGTASFAQTIASGLNITASNILVTNDLVVQGTASFGYTQTVTGSAVIIGDEFIILNASTPTAPFAGIKVYDTGSASTASLEWNGNGDYWIQVDEAGESAAMLTGASGSKGSEVFPTSNILLKGTGNSTIVDSNISDDGSTVSINSNTQITGSLNVSAGITGSGDSLFNGSNLFNGNQTITGSIFLQGNIEGPLAGADFGNQVLIQTSSRVTFVMDSPTQSLSFTNHPALNELMIVNNEANEKIIGFDYDRWTTNIKYGLETGVDFRGIDTLSGKLNITSSTPLIDFTGSIVDIAGTTTFTGSLLAKPQSFQATERPLPILEATDGTSTGGNLIFTRNTQALATGSVHVTGSSNFIALSNGLSNGLVTAGRGAIIRGTNSIFLGNLVQITGTNGSGYDRPAPTFTNATNAGVITVTDNRSTTTAAPLTFNSTNNNGGITATLTTGSVAFNNTMTFGSSGTVINVTGSAGAARSINSSMLGSFNGNRIDFREGSTGGNVIASMLMGNLLTASFSDTNTVLNSVSVLGYQLAVSASGTPGSTTLYGSTYVGRWNAQDDTSKPGLTTFAVGTGTSNAARRTSLHVSSSGLTTISDLSATGSLQGTASFADNSTSASYALNAESASFAVSASWAPTQAIDTGSLATTGSNTFVGDQVISGSLNIDGSYSGSNVVGNWTDTFTQPKVNQIVTITEAEYNTVSGSVEALNTLYIITDSTSSFATSASYAVTASYAATSTSASYAETSTSASYAFSSTSASYAANSTSASYANNSTSASYAITASYAENAGASFPYTGDAQIDGNLGVTGSIRGNIVTVTAVSNTGSIDLNEGNAFTFTTAADNLLNITNYPTGSNQKFSLLINNGVDSGSITFGDSFLFPSGSTYTPTLASGSVDILTFETYTY